MHNHSYENEFTLLVNELSFSYESMGVETRFEREADGNSKNGLWLFLEEERKNFKTRFSHLLFITETVFRNSCCVCLS